jgi:1-acyl-sn-glycerol-3-phosphate acyltransferase
MRSLRALPFLLLAPLVSAFSWLLAFLALSVSPRGRASNAALRLWARALLGVAGVRLVVRGAEHLAPDEPRVLVANHASYLDIPAVAAAFPGQLRIVAKSALRRTPFIGWHLALAGHFLIDRADPREGMRVLDAASKRLRDQRLSALLFAEGTRSPDGRLAPHKVGTFFLPLAAGVPVQPTAVLGSHALMPRSASAPRRRGTIEVRFGEPIPTAGLSGGPARKTLAAAVRASLLSLGVPDGGEAD